MTAAPTSGKNLAHHVALQPGDAVVIR